jgi:hypothetical protein
MSLRPEPWLLNPEDPRAPAQEVWDQLSEVERQHVVDSLPSDFPASEVQPPEGDQRNGDVLRVERGLRGYAIEARSGIHALRAHGGQQRERATHAETRHSATRRALTQVRDAALNVLLGGVLEVQMVHHMAGFVAISLDPSMFPSNITV